MESPIDGQPVAWIDPRGYQQDGQILPASAAIAANETFELFRFTRGEQQNGYTTANGFASGKPDDVLVTPVSSMVGQNTIVPKGWRFWVRGFSVRIDAFGSATAQDVDRIYEMQQILRFIDIEAGELPGLGNNVPLGKLIDYPPFAGAQDAYLGVATTPGITTQQMGANNGPVGQLRDLRLPLLFPAGASWGFNLVAKRAITPANGYELTVRPYGSFEKLA